MPRKTTTTKCPDCALPRPVCRETGGCQPEPRKRSAAAPSATPALAAYRTKVSVAASAYGTLQPQLELIAPYGTSYRAVRATVYHLACAVELATLEVGRDGWIVRVEHGPVGELLVLELIDGTEDEAARGVELLRAVATKAGAR